MDLICAYNEESGSSSEDAEEDGDHAMQSSSTAPTKVVQSHPGLLKTKLSNLSELEKNSGNVESADFFNLSSLKSKPNRPSPKAEQAKHAFKDIPGSIEVPNSEFWSEFVPVEDSNCYQHAPEETLHDEYYRKQTVDEINSSDFHPAFRKQSQRSQLGSESSYRKHSARNASHPYSNPYRTVSGGHIVRNASNSHFATQPCNVHSSEKRKVYYIHSKVAPYLHTHSVFRPASKTSASWSAHDGAVNRLHWNIPNFSHLLVTAGMDSLVCIWNIWSSMDKCVSTLSCHTKAVRHVEWCQGGRSVFTCSFDRTARVTDVESGKSKANFEHIGFVTAGLLLPSNPNLFATGSDNMIFLWDVRTPQAPQRHFTYKEAFGQVQDLAFIADDQELVSCADHVARDSADRSIMVWDVRSSAVLSNQVFQERYTCTRLKLHKDKSHFLAQTHGGYIALFSTSSPYRMEKSKRFGGHKLLGYHIGFDMSPDGKLVYSGSAEGGVHVYDYRTGKHMRKMATGSDDVIMDVACHPVLPTVLASCTWGGSIKLWQ